MTTNLQNANELLDRAAQLSTVSEQSFFALCVVLCEIEATGAFKEAGYESYADYVSGELRRSKSTASKLLKVGKWIQTSGFSPETLDTSYPRLYSAINALPEASADEVLAHASTLSEAEIITKRQEQKHNGTDHSWRNYRICEVCNEKEPVNG